MDIGTAKPTPEEQQQVPFHLLNLAEPDENITLAVFQQLAYEAIDLVHSKGSMPFLVGGTALYLNAIVEGWEIPHVPPILNSAQY